MFSLATRILRSFPVSCPPVCTNVKWFSSSGAEFSSFLHWTSFCSFLQPCWVNHLNHVEWIIWMAIQQWHISHSIQFSITENLVSVGSLTSSSSLIKMLNRKGASIDTLGADLQNVGYFCVVGLTEIKFTAPTVLCSAWVAAWVLVTDQCFGYCPAALSLWHSFPHKRGQEWERSWERTQPGQLAQNS